MSESSQGAPSDPDVLVRYLVVSALAVVALMFFVWRFLASEDRDAKQGARAECVARLGEAACDEHMSANHRVCFNYNNKGAGRFQARVFDRQGYVDCIVMGPDAWTRAVRVEDERRRTGAKSGTPNLP